MRDIAKQAAVGNGVMNAMLETLAKRQKTQIEVPQAEAALANTRLTGDKLKAEIPGVEADAMVKEAEAPTKIAITKATAKNPDLLTPDQQRQKKYQDAEIDLAAQRIGLERAKLFQDKEETQLTPEAVAKMSEMFATTGQLPALGSGNNAAKLRQQIINQAAKDFPSVQFASSKADFQANESSLRKLQTQSDAVNAFEATAGKNLDLFLSAANKVVDTGSPFLNKPFRSLSSTALGSENMAALNATRQTAVNEIGKVLNSATGAAAITDAARHEVDTLLDPNATVKQWVAAAKFIKQDMKNRHDSYADQMGAIRKRISGGNQKATPDKKVATVAQIKAYATAHKISEVEAKKAAESEGYEVQ